MKLGKSFKIGYIDDDGRFCPLAFAQSASIDMKTSTTEVSSPLTGGWVNRRAKRNSWSMQHEGLLGSDTATYTYQGKTFGFWPLMKKLWTDRATLTARWQETLTDGATGDMLQGQCIIEDLKQVASEKALTKVSVKLNGTGALRDLSAEDLTGGFAYSIQEHTLTLYAVSRPIANFSVHAGDAVVGTWDSTAAGRAQQFTDDAITPDSIITAWRGEGAAATQQTGVAFNNCTTLHVVLLQTEERDQMQQLHRYITPLWWGGLAMADMTLKRGTDTVATFATAGKTGSAPRVEIDPTIDITSGTGWSITTTAPQTLHCTDRTTSLQRTLKVIQMQSNMGSSPYIAHLQMLPDNFSCDFTVWGNDDEGVTAFTAIGESLPTSEESDTLLPDAQHLHWALTGLAPDEGGPYTIQRELSSDLAQHDVFYAYNSTSKTLRVWCPTQTVDTILLADGDYISDGLLYNVDAEGNRTPLTIAEDVEAFTSLSTAWGNYRFIDISTVQLLQSGRQFYLSNYCFDDIILTSGGVEVDRITFNAADPSLEYTSNAGVIDGAQMASGSVQTISYTNISNTSLTVSSKAQQTGTDEWRVRAYLTSSVTGLNTTIPANVVVTIGGTAVTIPAGSNVSSEVTLTAAASPAWVTPTAQVDPTWAFATEIELTVMPTIDTTPSHWEAMQRVQSSTTKYYDLRYNGGRLAQQLYVSSRAAGVANYIGSDRNMAVHLITADTSGSSTTPTITLRWGETDMQFQMQPSEINEPLTLFYIPSGKVYLCNCNPADGMSSAAPLQYTPQHTALYDIVDTIVTHPYRNTSVYTYTPVRIEQLSTSESPDKVVAFSTGVTYNASAETDMWVAFQKDGADMDYTMFENYVNVYNCQGSRIEWHLE